MKATELEARKAKMTSPSWQENSFHRDETMGIAEWLTTLSHGMLVDVGVLLQQRTVSRKQKLPTTSKEPMKF